MVKRTLVNLMLAGCLAAPAVAQDQLAAARELYASARYDEALALLNGLRPDGSNTTELRSIEQYRSLCLLALGRGTEAEAAIAAVVAADPMYLPSETEASPRVRTAFSEVRQRALPDIVRSRYATAKATFDRKDHVAAEQQFRDLLRLLDDPDMGGRLGDLRVLVQGFVDLSSVAAVAPAAPEPRREEAAPVAPPPATPGADPNRVFVIEDPGVVQPVAIRQEVPRVPTAIASQTRERGILDVTIDELGRVIHVALRISLHPVFDAQLLAAAREWRYQPAVFNGKPVKFRKIIQITVAKR
jgi:tetratricopeptide (TPR) repeat protein